MVFFFSMLDLWDEYYESNDLVVGGYIVRIIDALSLTNRSVPKKGYVKNKVYLKLVVLTLFNLLQTLLYLA